MSVVDDKTILTQGTGEALCRHARKVDANLIVMGSFAHGFERELMLGSATRDVYRAYFEMPVLLSH